MYQIQTSYENRLLSLAVRSSWMWWVILYLYQLQ